MRNSYTLLAIVLAATLASMAAVAGSEPHHNSDSQYSWSENGHSLSLHSTGRSGIVVDHTTPTPFHGLQSGDVILTIDGHPSTRVDELLQSVRKHGNSQITLRIRRSGAEVNVVWTPAEFQAMFPPAPAPPSPPPAP